MTTLFIILAALLLLIGLIGCLVPILPGPPLSYVAILLLHFFGGIPFSHTFLWTWGAAVVAVTVLDYVLPVWATKWSGGTRAGTRGSTFGLIIGLFFFPPLGLIIGPLIGALLGELMAGQNQGQAVKAALGAFVGFLTGTLAKLAVSSYLTFAAIQAWR